MAKAEGHSLIETPTYDVVIVLLTMVVFALVFERLLHALKHYLKHHGKAGLLAALDAMSTEIMLLGAITLILLALEDRITSICFQNDTNKEWTMLYRLRGCPCCLKDTARVTPCYMVERQCGAYACNCEGLNPQCLVGKEKDAKVCDAGDEIRYPQCGNREGFRPAITKQALHQIHIMVFLVALIHILCSIIMQFLAEIRAAEWKRWRQIEDEHITEVMETLDQQERSTCRIKQGRAFMHNKDGEDVEVDPAIGMQIADMVVFDDEADQEAGQCKVDMRHLNIENAPRRPSLDWSTSPGRRRVSMLLPSPSFPIRPQQPLKKRSPPVIEFLTCFLRQFTVSVVSFEEFAIMRASFVLTHKLSSSFDFVDYVLSQMQHDFSEVVGLGLGSWIQCCIFFLLAGTVGWPALWYSLAMIIVMLALNTKLISVIRHVAGRGTVHELGPNLFWLKRPWLLLKIVKLLLFLASFNIGTTIYFLIDYGPKSCFFTSDLHAGIVGGLWWEPIFASILVILFLGLETLPMYSISVQMGEKFRDERNHEAVSQHFRKLPRPDMGESVAQSLTQASITTMKRALVAAGDTAIPKAIVATVKGHSGGRWYGDTDSDEDDNKGPESRAASIAMSRSSPLFGLRPLGLRARVASTPDLQALAKAQAETQGGDVRRAPSMTDLRSAQETSDGSPRAKSAATRFHDALTRVSGHARTGGSLPGPHSSAALKRVIFATSKEGGRSSPLRFSGLRVDTLRKLAAQASPRNSDLISTVVHKGDGALATANGDNPEQGGKPPRWVAHSGSDADEVSPSDVSVPSNGTADVRPAVARTLQQRPSDGSEAPPLQPGTAQGQTSALHCRLSQSSNGSTFHDARTSMSSEEAWSWAGLRSGRVPQEPEVDKPAPASSSYTSQSSRGSSGGEGAPSEAQIEPMPNNGSSDATSGQEIPPSLARVQLTAARACQGGQAGDDYVRPGIRASEAGRAPPPLGGEQTLLSRSGQTGELPGMGPHVGGPAVARTAPVQVADGDALNNPRRGDLGMPRGGQEQQPTGLEGAVMQNMQLPDGLAPHGSRNEAGSGEFYVGGLLRASMSRQSQEGSVDGSSALAFCQSVAAGLYDIPTVYKNAQMGMDGDPGLRRPSNS